MIASSLTALNYANVLAYFANAVVTYGVGTLGWFGASTNGELSEKYQTLLTPVGWAFSIWGIIFISQLVWAIVQLFADFSTAPLVREGVKWYYLGVCVAQILWTIFFSMEYIGASLLAMLSILVFLLLIVRSQYRAVELCDVPRRDFWLLQFPFEIHAGWIVVASLLNISVVLVERGMSSSIQYYTALASLIGVVLIAAALAVGYASRTNFTIPLVLAWATFGIYFELKNPKELIVATFEDTQIQTVQVGAMIACGIILVTVTLVAIRMFLRARSATNSTSSETGEASYLRAEEGQASSSSKRDI